MDRFQTMAVFVQVVEQGSFARASERLGISTSACSRYVSELETHLIRACSTVLRGASR